MGRQGDRNALREDGGRRTLGTGATVVHVVLR